MNIYSSSSWFFCCCLTSLWLLACSLQLSWMCLTFEKSQFSIKLRFSAHERWLQTMHRPEEFPLMLSHDLTWNKHETKEMNGRVNAQNCVGLQCHCNWPTKLTTTVMFHVTLLLIFVDLSCVAYGMFISGIIIVTWDHCLSVIMVAYIDKMKLNDAKRDTQRNTRMKQS